MSPLLSLGFPLLMCLCCLGFGAIMSGGVFYLITRRVNSLNSAWGKLGLATGLTLKPGVMFTPPELSGQYRQRPLRLYTYTIGGGEHSHTYTALAVTVNNPAGSRLELTPSDTVGNLFGKMLNAQDVEVGNPDFDARFVIKSDPPDFAVKVLAEPGLQMRLMSIRNAFRIELEGPSLKYTRHGVEDNAETLTWMFNTLSDLADRVEAI